jgi:glutamate decarboxylase
MLELLSTEGHVREAAMVFRIKDLSEIEESDRGHASTYSTRLFAEEIPKYEIREKGMPADAAYQLMSDELNLDGNPALNLATFVTTWMEPEAQMLIAQNLHKNLIDRDEYPQTAEIENRVVNMLARLFNAARDKVAVGAGTVGSSEAILLALLARKRAWQKRREAQGKPTDRSNIVFGADVHVSWEKFARYFEVEPRIVPMKRDRYTLTVEAVADRVDENTICVGAVLGTTFTGQADPIKEINDLLLELKEEKGLDVPIHVDAASGGFIAPFINPELEWDFRLPQVKSINVSGHKFGLVYPGAGWLVFSDKDDLPEDLVFNVNYLGGDMPTYSLNFSRGASGVISQYYSLLRLGKEGYRRVCSNTLTNAEYLAKRIKQDSKLELLSETRLLPIVVVRLSEGLPFTAFDLSNKLRERGWIVPAYTMPPDIEDMTVLRVVVKENFSRDMADMFARDAEEAWRSLEGVPAVAPPKAARGSTGRIC